MKFLLNKNKIKELIFCFLFSIIFIIFLKIIIYAEVLEYDTNKDGKIDRWVYVQNGFVYKVEIDVNYDGKIDSIYIYVNSDKGPILQRIELDTDYDGVFDDFVYYENGKMVKEEIDSNNDGKVDIWIYIADGYIYKVEKDLNFDGKIDEVINY